MRLPDCKKSTDFPADGHLNKIQLLIRCSLVRRIRHHHHANGPDHDLEISPQAPVLDIINVQLHHIVKADFIAAADLPQAGTAGLDQQALLIIVGVLIEFARQARARADQAHGSAQNVPQLR